MSPTTVGLVVVASLLVFSAQVLTQTSEPGLRVVAPFPLGAHAHEVYDEVLDTNRALDTEERRRVREWFAANAGYHDVAPQQTRDGNSSDTPS